MNFSRDNAPITSARFWVKVLVMALAIFITCYLFSIAQVDSIKDALLAAIIISLLMVKTEPRLSMNMKVKQKSITFNEAFSNAIYKSVMGILSVGGVIVIFSVFSNFFDSSIESLTLLLSLNSNMSHIVYSLLVGSLEITNGCSIISSSPFVPMEVKLTVINFLISFSGMSVIFQTIAVINEFGFNINSYIGYKFIHGTISALICIAMLIFI